MISSMDYAIFGKFKALKELYIGENVLQDIFSCDSILQHLPQLTKFSVEGFQPNDDMEPMDDERGTNPNFKHSNIKSLKIRAFQEWGGSGMGLYNGKVSRVETSNFMWNNQAIRKRGYSHFSSYEIVYSTYHENKTCLHFFQRISYCRSANGYVPYLSRRYIPRGWL